MVLILTWSTRIVSTKRRLGLVQGLRRSIRRVACKREASFILNNTVVKTRAKKARFKNRSVSKFKIGRFGLKCKWVYTTQYATRPMFLRKLY